MKKLFLALCVCAGLCACSDDAIDGTSSSSIALDGNDVYLTVRLNDVNSSTRATSSGWQNGSSSEYNVTNAYFYFYDEDGLFVSRADVWDGGSATLNETGNIEFQSNTVVVLRGLTDKKFPRYMVTVLNEPTGFESSSYYEPAATLDEFQTKLANAVDAIYDSEGGNFVMSTSAYATPVYEGSYAVNGESDISPWYFVTPINESDFKEEPVEDLSPGDAVQVYVERLAAKVEVDVSSALVATGATFTDANGDTHVLYDSKETVAGQPNDEYDVTLPDGETYAEGVDDVYIEFLGWALNGTARNSNIVKDITNFVGANGQAQTIDDSWLASDWNDASNFRSYWGASYNYGIDVAYPTSNVNRNGVANDDDAEESPETWLNDYLKYTSLLTTNDFGFNTGDYEYCAENTNTTDVLGDNKNSSAITNALVKARAWINTGTAEEPNYVAESLVRFEGELFTEDYFIDYINRRVSADVPLYGNLYYATDLSITTPPNDEYGYTKDELEEDFGITTLILASSENWLVLESNPYGNDSVYIELDEDAFDATINQDNDGAMWIEAVVATEAAVDGRYQVGDTLYYLLNLQNEEVLAGLESDIRSAIDALNTDYEMIGYNNGLMYYAIPIEHLNDTTPPEVAPNNLFEANYGIVRNHWYQITINSVSNLGKGIWDETQVIIPDLNPYYYYVDADINILSWKMVQQGADL